MHDKEIVIFQRETTPTPVIQEVIAPSADTIREGIINAIKETGHPQAGLEWLATQ